MNAGGVRKEQVLVDVLGQGDVYLLQERVKVYPDSHGDEFIKITAEDFIVFPNGMNCTWTSPKSTTSSRARVSTIRFVIANE
jgi:hypothetical protein